MAAYRKISQQTIKALYDAYVQFHNERVKIINYIRDKKIAEWKAERDSDLRAERYNQRSILEWYDNNLRKMQKWLDECEAALDECDRNFNAAYSEVQRMRFYNQDQGTHFTVSFEHGNVTRKPHTNNKDYSLTFLDYSWIYSWDPIPTTEAFFHVPKPQFSELFYE